jgi:hypothetical protein
MIVEYIWVGWCDNPRHRQNQEKQQEELEKCCECNKFIKQTKSFTAEDQLAASATSSTTASMQCKQRLGPTENDGQRVKETDESDKLGLTLFPKQFETLEEAVQYLLRELDDAAA